MTLSVDTFLKAANMDVHNIRISIIKLNTDCTMPWTPTVASNTWSLQENDAWSLQENRQSECAYYIVAI